MADCGTSRSKDSGRPRVFLSTAVDLHALYGGSGANRFLSFKTRDDLTGQGQVLLGCGLPWRVLEDAPSVNRRFAVLHASVDGHGEDDVVTEFFGEQCMDIAIELGPRVVIAHHDAQELQVRIKALLDLIHRTREGFKALE